MRLRALFRVGARLVVTSGWSLIVITLAGVHAAWIDWIFMILFAGGVSDMGIAAWYDLRARLRGDDGDSHAAVEFDENGIHFWFGERAQENRGKYLEGRDARPDGRPPQKRLLPMSPSLRAQGVEFPGQLAYNLVDRYGVRTPPFPVHFRTEPETHELIDGARMGSAVIKYHIDSVNPGCPVCETWEREWGLSHG